jgi:hypothetical protein
VTGASEDALHDLFLARVALIRAREERRVGWRNLWLAHHWPDRYGQRCVHLGGRPVCRRCAALYPLGLLMAWLTVAVGPPWPEGWDPWAVWLLSIPATVAYVGESLGWFGYSPRWQVGTTLVAAVAFGRALGAQWEDPGTWLFWGPIAVFGAIWLAATVAAHTRRA